MKTKLTVGIFVMAVLLCQGFVFAESADNITATAEDVVFTEDSASGGVMNDIVTTDDLAAPSVDPTDSDAEDVKI